ncbi:DeoR/GlpR family DNA-binding transcription regulator [Vagococcus lutrae]|uniref:Lactose phosphotransferase system repressor n=1 Tax=Vagococcus lutrae TaxID=81947 RepID=A0AAE9XEN2_9ENTE|nr:DeoR/GlpR family DNA-binding transcription regulator [Vagococcus lutrae]WCG22899.1 DeoR/GlpR family DNA-binding transcription regulator [Vagococcus lutrae]
MLKSERLSKMIELVNSEGVISANKLMQLLNVSDMTIRRDLEELDNAGKLVRVHGGAQSLNYQRIIELSHDEKKELNIREKIDAACKAAKYIKENETVFFGPGTTIEAIVDFIDVKELRIVTNSLSVFEKFQQKNAMYEIYLVGGSYRDKTRTFVGSIANEVLTNLKFDKAFIGVNGINETQVSTYNIEEGSSQKIALNNSILKIIVADHYKFDKEDFYQFYPLSDIDLIITDDGIEKDKFTKYVNLVNLK